MKRIDWTPAEPATFPNWEAALNTMLDDLFDAGYEEPEFTPQGDDGVLVRMLVAARSPEGELHTWEMVLQRWETQVLWDAIAGWNKDGATALFLGG